MNNPLIEPAEFLKILPDVKILDASYGVPDAFGAFSRERIGNAWFFDIDAVADPDAPYAHTLPDPEDFEAIVSAMGIGNDDEVVIYDQTGITFAASRAWWMFRVMGHEKVRVLNGGLPAWKAAGLPLETGAPAMPQAKSFKAQFRPALYRSFEQIEDSDSETIIDARAPARFNATVRSVDGDMVPANIPGSRNQSFSDLLDQNGRMKNADAIAPILLPHIEPGNKMVATCGSGVTACVLALGFYAAGYPDVAVYDGSWTEWSDRNSLR